MLYADDTTTPRHLTRQRQRQTDRQTAHTKSSLTHQCLEKPNTQSTRLQHRLLHEASQPTRSLYTAGAAIANPTAQPTPTSTPRVLPPASSPPSFPPSAPTTPALPLQMASTGGCSPPQTQQHNTNRQQTDTHHVVTRHHALYRGGTGSTRVTTARKLSSCQTHPHQPRCCCQRCPAFRQRRRCQLLLLPAAVAAPCAARRAASDAAAAPS